MIKIGVVGASGRTGTKIVEQIANSPDLYELTIAVTPSHKDIESRLNQVAKCVTHDKELLKKVDVVIDFSTPASSMQTLKICLAHKVPIVIGTTGFSSHDQAKNVEASQSIPILLSPNMSISVNILFRLTEIVAKTLSNFETEIIETHHRYKKDAPSGTAIKLGETIAKSRNIDFNQYAKFTRYGINEERNPKDIGFATIRGGDIVGKHEVLFINDGETLTLTSEINNRQSFAYGATIAATFLINKPPRLYSMFDVLNV